MKTCTYPDCSNTKVIARGLCRRHYRHWPELAAPKIRQSRDGVCSIAKCYSPIEWGGMCNLHQKRIKAHGDPNANFTLRKKEGKCGEPSCSLSIATGDYCSLHYSRFIKTGALTVKNKVKGSWRSAAKGYIAGTRDGRKVYQHVWVAEKALGKRLPRGTEVHHLNEDRTDNRSCNLIVCDKSYHMYLHKMQRLTGYTGPAKLTGTDYYLDTE